MSVALIANEEERGGAMWMVGLVKASLQWYKASLCHALIFTVDVSQWLVDALL